MLKSEIRSLIIVQTIVLYRTEINILYILVVESDSCNK